MKNLHFYFPGRLTLLALLFSIISTTSWASKEVQLSTPPELPIPKLIHDITFKQLVSYISEFNQSTASASVSALTDFGYVNAVSLAQQLQGKQGVVFHYCLGEGANAVPYLAYRAIADSGSTAIDGGGMYFQSYGEGTLPFNTTSSIMADLLSSTSTLLPEVKTVSGSVVAADAARFNGLCSLFKIDNRAYFNAAEIAKLIAENNAIHLKYYFGFDDSEIINHLRLCFIGVDPVSQKNAIKHPITQEFFTFIDRSWP